MSKKTTGEKKNSSAQSDVWVNRKRHLEQNFAILWFFSHHFTHTLSLCKSLWALWISAVVLFTGSEPNHQSLMYWTWMVLNINVWPGAKVLIRKTVWTPADQMNQRCPCVKKKKSVNTEGDDGGGNHRSLSSVFKQQILTFSGWFDVILSDQYQRVLCVQLIREMKLQKRNQYWV